MALGIGVKVKIPKPITDAARELPELRTTGNRFASVMDAFNTTLQSVAVLGAVGVVVAALIWAGKKK